MPTVRELTTPYLLLTDALKDDIETDKQVALRSLERSTYSKFAADAFFASSKL